VKVHIYPVLALATSFEFLVPKLGCYCMLPRLIDTFYHKKKKSKRKNLASNRWILEFLALDIRESSTMTRYQRLAIAVSHFGGHRLIFSEDA